MTITLTNEQVRDLIPLIDRLDGFLTAAEFDAERRTDLLPAIPVLEEIVNAVRNAKAADRTCRQCGGTGTIMLPIGHGDDAEIDDRVCPVCRPWPQGFPGLIAKAFGDNGPFNVWAIAPYGPGENVHTKREIAPPLGHVAVGPAPEPF